MLLSHYMFAPARPLRFRSMRDDAAAATTGGGSATTTSTAAPGTTASTATPAPSTPASQTGTPAPTTPAASTTGTTDPEVQDGNWKQLRDAYGKYKSRAEVLDSLGIPDADLPGVAKNWTTISTKAATMAKALGYEDSDFKTAFEQDPLATLQLLQSETATAAESTRTPAATTTETRRPGETQAEFDARIDALVEARTKPFTEHINKQISDQTVAKIGTELTAAMDADLPGAPVEIRDIVKDYVEEYLAGQPAILSKMKTSQDFAVVKETVNFVTGRLKSAFAAWVKAETTRTSGRPATAATPAAVRPATGRYTLDQMIEDPSLIGEAYK